MKKNIFIFCLLFFACHTYGTNYSGFWTSISVSPNIEGDTGTYIITGVVPTSLGATGDADIPAGSPMFVSLPNCASVIMFSGGTIQGFPISSPGNFTTPLLLAEGDTFTIVLHGIGIPLAGTYSGTGSYDISAITLNNTGGLNTFNTVPSYTTLPHTPTPGVFAVPNNKVPNPSFELYTTCSGNISNATPWIMPTFNGSSDYISECFGCGGIPLNSWGYQRAKTGGSHAGLYSTGIYNNVPYREYVQAPLICPLIIGQTYNVGIYISFGESSMKASDGMGILLSTDSATAPGVGPVINRIPQFENPSGNILRDSINWVFIGGTFTADSAYKFITIGNFKDNTNTNTVTRPGFIFEAYYYIDDISVAPIIPPITGITNICSGGTTTLTAPPAAGYLWNTGATTPSITVSPNDTTFYKVELINGTCIDSISTTVYVDFGSTAPTAVLSGGDSLCAGETTAMSVVLSGTPPWSLTYSDGTINTSITGITTSPYTITTGTAGTYTINNLYDANCTGTSTGNATVVVDPVPTANFSCPESGSLISPTIEFSNNSSNAISWLWDFGDIYNNGTDTSTLEEPSYTYTQPDNYCITLIVKSTGECYDSTENCLTIDEGFTFYIPNAFSPNGDGINDEFYSKGKNIDKYEISIYNRWGEMIFYTDNINEYWTGKIKENDAPHGVYTYVINLKEATGNSHKYIGRVTLMK